MEGVAAAQSRRPLLDRRPLASFSGVLKSKRRLESLAKQLHTPSSTAAAPAPRNPKELRLLHSGDLHLYKGLTTATDGPNMDLLLGKAVELSVDALLIVGDIFDINAVPQDHIDEIIRMIGQCPMPVVIQSGNHDGEIWEREATAGKLPDNMVLLAATDGEVKQVPSLGLTVWGKSTKDHTPDFKPLAGLPDRKALPEGTEYYVALAHGLYATDPRVFQGRSSLIFSDEVAGSTTDYIALGHVHVFRDCSAGGKTAFYSGSPWDAFNPTAALVTLRSGMETLVEQVDFPKKEKG